MDEETPEQLAPDTDLAAADEAAPASGGRLSSAQIAALLDGKGKGDADDAPAGDADEDQTDEEDQDAEADEQQEEEVDSDLDKRVGSIQKQEKRSRDQAELTRLELLRDIDARKAAFEAEWTPRLAEAQRVTQIFERVKEDPSVLADELDLDAEAMIKLGERFYAFGHDKKGDPKFKQVAENMRRDSATRRESSALQRQIAELNEKLETQVRERAADEVVAKASTALGDKHPVLKSLEPEYVQSRIRAATQYLHQKTGARPDPADVLAKLEQIEREDLLQRVGKQKFDSLGFGPKPADPKTTKQKTKPADKKETAPPMKQTPQKYSPPNRRRSAEEILAEMDADQAT